jgi:hypothetical protein
VTIMQPSLGARRPGRPPSCPPEVAVRIVTLHQQGLSYGAITSILNAEGLTTPAGRPRWQRSYVDRVLHTRYAKEILQAYLASA